MLIIIPTPIGNLEDITIRALKFLRNCDLILAEDTRRTLKLISRYSIKKPLFRYNEHSEKSVAEAMRLLLAGKNVALVSDSGTPCISDPGWKLVNLTRQNKIKVEVLPGPSALTAVVSGSGWPVNSFVFLGFLPRSRGKILKALKSVLETGRIAVLYESPYRLKNLVEIVSKEISPAAELAIAREISKVFEEWIIGRAEDILKDISGRNIKGEIAVLIRMNRKTVNNESDEGKGSQF